MKILRNESIGDKQKAVNVVIKYDNFGNRLLEEYFDSNNKLIYSYKFIYTYY